MNDIVIYTDGSCLDNPGPGGWAAVLTCDAGEKRICGGAKETTNNRMELMAVINALSMLKGPSVVTVYSDSQYIIRAFNDGWIENWKKRGWTKGTGEPVANKDLWQTLELSARQHTITWVWVKGHADNAYNNICDKMARATAEKYARGELPAPGQADQDDFTIPEEDAIGSEDYVGGQDGQSSFKPCTQYRAVSGTQSAKMQGAAGGKDIQTTLHQSKKLGIQLRRQEVY